MSEAHESTRKAREIVDELTLYAIMDALPPHMARSVSVILQGSRNRLDQLPVTTDVRDGVARLLEERINQIEGRLKR